MNLDKAFIALSAALAIGLPAFATAWAQAKIGAAGAGSLAEKPELTGTIVILVAIPETMVILGFGVLPQPADAAVSRFSEGFDQFFAAHVISP